MTQPKERKNCNCDNSSNVLVLHIRKKNQMLQHVILDEEKKNQHSDFCEFVTIIQLTKEEEKEKIESKHFIIPANRVHFQEI